MKKQNASFTEEIAEGVMALLSKSTGDKLRAAAVRGLYVVGMPGSGKTLLVKQLLESVSKAGEAAVIHDPFGDILKAHHSAKRGDIVFNAFDARFGWTVFNEIKTAADCKALAKALMAPHLELHALYGNFWTLGTEALLAQILEAIATTERTPLSRCHRAGC